MSRSGYTDDFDDVLMLGRYRAQIQSATRGRRGQKFFRDLVAALDALPEKRLIQNELTTPEGVCALGALAQLRAVNITDLDPEDHDALGVQHR